MINIHPIALEETEGCGECERQTIHFKFKYLFSKDPCEKCLVKAACNKACEIKYDYWDQLHSIKDWKKKLKNRFHTIKEIVSLIFIAIWFFLVITILMEV